MHAETSSPSFFFESSIKDTVILHASVKLLSRGQSLSARLFVALPCCHSLMVPRRIGDVSCGENHTV